MTSESDPTTHRLNGPSDLLPLVATFSDLSHGTEFKSYKDSQWRFLLNGDEITGFAIYSEGEKERLDGCVLKVHLDDDTVGFGMVLVRPSKRGRGLARALIEKAMQLEKEREKRCVLAVCSPLGQPLYRKLGFRDAGMVTTLTCSVSDLMQIPRKHFDNEYLLAIDGKSCKNEQLSLLVNHDASATGINRKDRIKLLLHGYAEGSRSTVAFLSTVGPDLDRFSTAVARQDCADGPLVIGPMKGREECCIPLMHALVEKHFGDEGGREMNDVGVMMMVTDHPNLVARLLEIKGMSKVSECPAMASDGGPIYQNGDGSYLAMMHPTLG